MPVVNGTNHINGDFCPSSTSDDASSVLIVGGAVVGCLVALKLGQAGINSTIIEKQPAVNESPRAVGYYGAAQPFLDEVGLYKLIRDKGFMTRGLCWRKRPIDDGKGGKALGEMIAHLPLCTPGDTSFEVGAGLLNLPQADLNKIVLREALKTGHVRIQYNTELVSIVQNSAEEGVVAVVEDVGTKARHEMQATYLVGADGARSETRKALGLPFSGHTWPERLIATNVMVKNEAALDWQTWFVLDRVHYTIATPLQDPVVGSTTLWRYTIAADPEDPRSDEELLTDANIMQHYENVMAGPRPLQVDIQARATYRIHQRLVPTMRRDNCLLAGDAAHVNNPYGAMGLNTGILDADALAEALIMVINEKHPASILDVYSDERRKVFQFFVDPTSTQNKLRVHSHPEDRAIQEDWFFRMMNNPTPKQLKELARPYFETWRTNIRELAKSI